MKIFKYLLFLLLIVLIGASIYIATKDGNFQVEETQIFDAPQELIFNEVNNFENWQYWAPWSTTSKANISFGDTIKGVGASYAWEKGPIGEGRLKTIESKPFSEITQKIKISNLLGEANNKVSWNFDPLENNKTQVTWTIKGSQSFKEKFWSLFEDQTLAERIQPEIGKGLAAMQKVIDNKMNEYSITVDGVVNHGGGYYMYMTTASKISQVNSKMRPMITEVSNFMETQGFEKLGNPVVIYNEWNQSNNSAIFSAGYFTPNEVRTPIDADVLNGGMPNQKVLKTVLKGKYDNIEEAWKKAYEYIDENGLEIAQDAKAFEVYITNPIETVNPADWITNIYIPIKEIKND
ncbi:GyrI-like domain-containing protein [Zunongwangia sp. HGR-M22]|uniref:GyrI-like domain-containing protein n=1 Tax=Zunongwangia sp. HGR-M22 TaxID=3015168 RepID=UPI0022DE1BF5|nr:GyrI-like domain-containing protein [Zunongwangia sp. HGR-M22]WBL26609.1 GyrI-like domain-containing protein [Zunongwangia sp. HGR-M22]